MDTDAEIAKLHDISEMYWGAINGYDADTAVALYEEDYRLVREEQLRSDIDRLSRFRVKLGITEREPPILTASNVGELYINVKDPLSVRTVWMIFHKLDGKWQIVYAEQVEE